jgi:TonB family protein
MFDQLPKPGRLPAAQPSVAPRQHRLMLMALSLLLVALGLVLYRDRDFWFPDTIDASDQPLRSAPARMASANNEPARIAQVPKKARAHGTAAKAVTVVDDAPLPPTTITRTVLPPLEVEVVAGASHHTLRPGTNSVHVDLQPAENQNTSSAETTEADTADAATTAAADRGPVLDDNPVVTESIQPDYPMLARQMKVQGAVILQAFIGRDGLIQDLRVISGPPILATAAQEAVKQWHFKPHFEGAQAVETQAKITVNFTISTN